MSNLRKSDCLTEERNCRFSPFLLGEWQEWQGSNKPAESTPKRSNGFRLRRFRPKADNFECLTFRASLTRSDTKGEGDV
jgi:hypothetical protein